MGSRWFFVICKFLCSSVAAFISLAIGGWMVVIHFLQVIKMTIEVYIRRHCEKDFHEP